MADQGMIDGIHGHSSAACTMRLWVFNLDSFHSSDVNGSNFVVLQRVGSVKRSEHRVCHHAGTRQHGVPLAANICQFRNLLLQMGLHGSCTLPNCMEIMNMLLPCPSGIAMSSALRLRMWAVCWCTLDAHNDELLRGWREAGEKHDKTFLPSAKDRSSVWTGQVCGSWALKAWCWKIPKCRKCRAMSPWDTPVVESSDGIFNQLCLVDSSIQNFTSKSYCYSDCRRLYKGVWSGG